MAIRGGDPAIGGLDELVWRAHAEARDPRLPEVVRREAAAYARGLEQAVYVLTGRLVG